MRNGQGLESEILHQLFLLYSFHTMLVPPPGKHSFYPAKRTSMCGIVGIFDLKKKAEELRPQALNMSRRQRHRGPDWSGIFVCEKSILVHERLSIVDPTSGKQPLFSSDGTLALAVNGEIYNHRLIRKTLKEPYHFKTTSDCEVVIPLVSYAGREG